MSSSPTLELFTSELVEKLKVQSTAHLVVQGRLCLRLGRQGVVRFELEKLFEEVLSLGRPLSESVELLARDFAERSLGLPLGRELMASVLPVVRDDSFLCCGEGAARREGPAGLWFFYVTDDPERVAYVPESLLGTARITLEELDEAAWRNLEARPAEVRPLDLQDDANLLPAHKPTGLWALARGDGHDAARLLTQSHQSAMEKVCGAGPLRVYLGLRELALFCREDDWASVRKLQGLDAAPEGIEGELRLCEGRLRALPSTELDGEPAP